MKSKLSAPQKDHFGLERIIFFSDAVFAIAITLLALEIRLPVESVSLNDAELFQQLMSIGPAYLGFAISFLVIGGFWIGHHRRFRFIERYDSRLMFLNLLILMCIAFIPFPTSILSEYGNLTATVFYAATMAVTGIFSSLLWMYASRGRRLVPEALDDALIRNELRLTLIVPVVFVVSIGLAFINPDFAMFSWFAILPAMFFLK